MQHYQEVATKKQIFYWIYTILLLVYLQTDPTTIMTAIIIPLYLLFWILFFIESI